MRIRKLLTTAAAVACLGTPAAIALSSAPAQAMAVQHVRPYVAQPFYIEDGSTGHTASPTECMNPHGTGNQVTIEHAACTSSTWTEANDSSLPSGCLSTDVGESFADGNGLYLAPGSNHTLTVSSTQFFWCVRFNKDFFLLLVDPSTGDFVGTDSTAGTTGVEVDSGLTNTGWANTVV